MDQYEIGTRFYCGPTTWMMCYQGDIGRAYIFSQGIPGLEIGPTLELAKKSFNNKFLVLYHKQKHILYSK